MTVPGGGQVAARRLLDALEGAFFPIPPLKSKFSDVEGVSPVRKETLL